MNSNLDAMTASLESIPEVVFAYLFGSHATGRAHAESDVDIAVHLGGRRVSDRTKILEKLIVSLSSAVASHRLDLVILDDAPVVLRQQVLRHGKLLFCRDRSFWAEFLVRTVDEYADTAPMRALHVRATRERILEGKGFGQPGDFERSLARVRELFGKDPAVP